jgi:tRNA 2-selenouridine synthase
MMPADFKTLFISNTPLIDVRAAVEFAQGAFPSAVNLPILNDNERHAVGISYKQDGADAAERLGHELVSGNTRALRLQGWQAFADKQPNTRLYCFRGGKRSELAVEWLRASGYNVLRIPGGYKALRGYLIGVLDALPALMVLGGKTGNGKTDLLANLSRLVDLEKHANHRGSAFGRQLAAQPSQIDFENAVAISFLKVSESNPGGPVVVEDEGRLIGRVSLPVPLQAAMKRAPLVLLEGRMEDRVERILNEYIIQQYDQFLARETNPNLALEAHSAVFLAGIDGIKKRLGGVEHQRLRASIVDAFKAQGKGDFQQHRGWIRDLLGNYYDPMYDYQINIKAERIIFKGDFDSVTEYLRSLEAELE